MNYFQHKQLQVILFAFIAFHIILIYGVCMYQLSSWQQYISSLQPATIREWTDQAIS